MKWNALETSVFPNISFINNIFLVQLNIYSLLIMIQIEEPVNF